MNVALKRGDITTRAAGIVALGVLEGTRTLAGAAKAVDRVAGGAISAALASKDFRGRHLENIVLYPSKGRAKRILLVGLGRARDLTADRVRAVAALSAGRARDLEAGTLASVVYGAGAGGVDPARAAHACAEGSVLGHYRFTEYRTDDTRPPLRSITFLERDADLVKVMRPAMARGAAWAEGTCLARDLASTPGQDMTPRDLAERAKQIGRATGAKVKALGVAELEKLGLGGLLAVGRGSVNPPRLIIMQYVPEKPAHRKDRPIVIVGKGVTFDTGGISLKPREGMQKMKYDMSGGAAVLGFFQALPSIAPPFPVIGLVPTAENMPDGAAFKPGDILKMIDGTTVEILNTDAEGRLLLADALGYARQNYDPQAVVDLATLTGAVSIAVGSLAAGVFTDHDDLARELIHAGDAEGERLWRLPLWDDYTEFLRGDASDLKSTGGRAGGATIAAAFLKHFARDMYWAHLDIASRAWSETGSKPHEQRGPTGFGVRLLLEWVRRRAEAANELGD